MRYTHVTSRSIEKKNQNAFKRKGINIEIIFFQLLLLLKLPFFKTNIKIVSFEINGQWGKQNMFPDMLEKGIN